MLESESLTSGLIARYADLRVSDRRRICEKLGLEVGPADLSEWERSRMQLLQAKELGCLADLAAEVEKQKATDVATDDNRLSDLASRLTVATEGSRGLSDEVLEAMGWQSGGLLGGPTHWYEPGTGTSCCDGEQPDPTRSVDDAIALVPAGCAWKLTQRLDGLSPTALLQRRGHGRKPFDIWVDVEAATPALALSLALCRAAKRIQARAE